jgi:hypothetical protein
MKRQPKSIRSCTDPPADLTGTRFGKWTVLKYAGQRIRYWRGQKFSTRMWLCRCDCGVQKQVPHYNLTGSRSKQCRECCRLRHGMSSTRLYHTWDNLKRSGKLAKEWQDFDAFRKAVGDPPDKKAYLTRYDGTKSHSPENTFWMYPGLLQNDPALHNLLKQIRKKSREERIAHDKMLMRIRKATSTKERNRCMIAARKAGHSCGLIGMAANVTTQRAHFIVATRCR